MAPRSSAPNAGRVSRADVITEPRRAPASFALSDASGAVSQSGEAEALIADDALIVGAVSVSYVFREGIDAVNRDLQLMHFRRAPLALTESQAALTSDNPHGLALRKLDPVKRLRAGTVARLMHTAGWSDALQSSLPARARSIASLP
jgi:hypothetical protein